MPRNPRPALILVTTSLPCAQHCPSAIPIGCTPDAPCRALALTSPTSALRPQLRTCSLLYPVIRCAGHHDPPLARRIAYLTPRTCRFVADHPSRRATHQSPLDFALPDCSGLVPFGSFAAALTAIG
jgi:hypothetical protein